MPDYEEQNWETGDTFHAGDATEMSQELEEQEVHDAAQDALIAAAQATLAQAGIDIDALETLIANKVDKTATAWKVYGTDASGNQVAHTLATTALVSTVPLRSTNGVTSVGAPTATDHATTKGYVDTADALKVDKAPVSIFSLSANEYAAVYQVELSAQAQDCRIEFEITGYQGANTPALARVQLGIRQEAALNNAPLVDLRVIQAQRYTDDQFFAVITEVTASKSTVVVMYKNVAAFQTLWRRTISYAVDAGVVVTTPTVGAVSVPAGTQVLASPKFTEIVGNAAGGATLNVGLTKCPVGAIGARVTCIAPGPGGGSGRRGAPGTIRVGGGGGASAPQIRDWYIPLYPGDQYSATILPAGVGGAAVTTDDTNGNAGDNPAGRLSGFFITGVKSRRCLAYANAAAISGQGGGLGAGGACGITFAGGTIVGLAGGNGQVAGTAGVSGGSGTSGQIGGAGSGGGITAANVASNGGPGGSNYNASPAAGSLSAGGVVDGALPGRGEATAVDDPASGPGGGASSVTTHAQAGADAISYGQGGGGGGASTNGFNSGRGGNGGPGYIRVEWVYG